MISNARLVCCRVVKVDGQIKPRFRWNQYTFLRSVLELADASFCSRPETRKNAAHRSVRPPKAYRSNSCKDLGQNPNPPIASIALLEADVNERHADRAVLRPSPRNPYNREGRASPITRVVNVHLLRMGSAISFLRGRLALAANSR